MKTITKREKLIYITFFSVLISILLLSTITDIYARYSSIISGSGNIELAKWSFKVNEVSEGENFAIDIKTDGAQTKILPESTGTFTIKVENESNVPAQYSIELSEKFMNTQIGTDTLKIYTDSTYKTIIDLEDNILQGKLQEEEEKVITLYWKWNPNKDTDQVIAEHYDGFTLSAIVTGEQTTIAEDENTETTIKTKD